MLELVCSYMNKWMKEGKQLKPVSVNQSRADIEQDSFFEDFCSIVDRYEIPHEYLTFELTESAFIEEGNRIMKHGAGTATGKGSSLRLMILEQGMHL